MNIFIYQNHSIEVDKAVLANLPRSSRGQVFKRKLSALIHCKMQWRFGACTADHILRVVS